MYLHLPVIFAGDTAAAVHDVACVVVIGRRYIQQHLFLVCWGSRVGSRLAHVCVMQWFRKAVPAPWSPFFSSLCVSVWLENFT